MVASLENGLQSPREAEIHPPVVFSGPCGVTEAASYNGILPQGPTSATIGRSLKKATESGIGTL